MMRDIPPREPGHAYALTFWGDLVPHVGVTGNAGHFMASYGTYEFRKTKPDA